MFKFIIFFILFSGTSLQKICNYCDCNIEFNKCDCAPTFNSSKCTENSNVLISDEKVFIPQQVQKLSFKNLNISELIFNNELLELYAIEFDNCNITLITDESFTNVETITHLSVINNPDLILESGCFDVFVNLVELNLVNNQLDNLPDLILSDLEILTLNSNYLRRDLVFDDLTNLKTLNLAFNGIRRIHELNTNLENIDLTGNFIEFFNASIIEDLSKLKILNLNLNPLNCNCSMRDLYDKQKNELLFVFGECLRPKINLFHLMKREDFKCPNNLKISETRKYNIITLNCFAENDIILNWEYKTLKYKTTESKNSIKIEIDLEKPYRNEFTCIGEGEKLGHLVIYNPPEKSTEKPTKNTKKIVNNKIAIYKFKSKKDFSIKYNIKLPEDMKNAEFIISLTGITSTEFISSLTILYDFPAKLSLQVYDSNGPIQPYLINNTIPNIIKKKTKDLTYEFSYKGHKLVLRQKINFQYCVKQNLDNIKDFRDLGDLGANNFVYKCSTITPASLMTAVKKKFNRADVVGLVSIGAGILIVAIFAVIYKKWFTSNKQSDDDVDSTKGGSFLNPNEIISLLSEKVDQKSETKDSSSDESMEGLNTYQISHNKNVTETLTSANSESEDEEFRIIRTHNITTIKTTTTIQKEVEYTSD